jgi:predicted nucleotidyltransferase component of viral defense system
MNIWRPHVIREKLENKAKELGLRLPQMQILLAQERFLARLYSIPEGKNFIWKGGSLFLRKYSNMAIPRFTVDIDLLVKGFLISQTPDIFEKAIKIDLLDGFQFKEISSVPMERQTPYGGDRFEINWRLFNKNQSETLKIDVCAGDEVLPISSLLSDLFIYPEVDGQLSANIYPAEFIFAEKLETIFHFGTGNTRVKDIIDIWSLSKGKINQKKLKEAILICFKNRNQIFNYLSLQEIFHDKFFLKNIDRILNSQFERLNLLPTEIIFEEILDFIQKLNLGYLDNG